MTASLLHLVTPDGTSLWHVDAAFVWGIDAFTAANDDEQGTADP